MPVSATGSLSASATGSMRRPASVVAAVRGDGRGTHSRSEVSLTRAQAVWSPQISAEASTFSGSPLSATTGLTMVTAATATATSNMLAAAGLAVATDDESLRPEPASTPVISPASARALHLRVPRGTSLRPTSSVASSSSPNESPLSPTSFGSPQFPTEATRMLRQAIQDQSQQPQYHYTQRRSARSEEPSSALTSATSTTVESSDLPNAARMSTWSASSGRTLSEDHRTSKPLASAALSSLNASAALINRPSHSSTKPRYRQPSDLGLSMRSDLERRVRSFSASEANGSLRSAVRPHSSMGFHGSVARRHHSPHLLARGGSGSDKLIPHRLSAAGISLQDMNDNDNDADDTISLSSQATERLPPTPPNTATYSSVATTKRRAQTIAHPE
ncbi:hypothetical protein IW150_002517 [Coemansia sp. RSA 2607]|nr:hypothetical protein IW150_002517 [Coemansia sp. RSA 2607]